MIVQPYIVVSKTGRCRLVKTAPSLDWDEVAIRLSIELPKELFEKPRLESKIVVPKEAVQTPFIATEVIDNIQEIVKQNTGIEIKLQIIKEDNEE